MNITNTSDRIWLHLLNTERLTRYYSKRSKQLESRQRWVAFSVAIPIFVSLWLYQSDWDGTNTLASILLFFTGIFEAAVIRFGTGGDVKAAKIVSIQTNELAQQWRRLWRNQHRSDIEQWVDVLEVLTIRATSEQISPSRNLKGENYLTRVRS